MARLQTVEASKKRKRDAEGPVDEEITDISSEDIESQDEVVDEDNLEEQLDSDEEFEGENPADKRRRLAKQYLENLESEAKEINEGFSGLDVVREKGDTLDDYNNFDARDLDRDIVASRLKEDVAEQQGRVYRWISGKLLLGEAKVSFTRVGSNNLTCLSCYKPALNKFTDNTKNNNKNTENIIAYTVSKDLQLTKFDVTDFNARPKKVKYVKGGRKYIPEGKFEFENTTEGHYDEILTVAASPDGKYVVTGGRDKKLIIWSAESLAPVKVIPTKDRRGEILALTFRRNSDQLYVACADFKIRTYAINQFSQLEILYGHQDLVVDISALGMERCVTVGSRDRTAMLWKIADETRLTFRGGDNPEKLLRKWLKNNETNGEETSDTQQGNPPQIFSEGSIDCISMIDDSHFVTGSDNGSISLWSLSKKKPVFIFRAAHGVIPAVDDKNISGEKSSSLRHKQLQDGRIAQPYWITSLYAIPYSDTFISGSWNGSLKVWKLNENLREFELLGELPNCKGVVTKIQVVEKGKHGREAFRILASVSKEHKLGRWISKVPGARNGIYSAVLEQVGF